MAPEHASASLRCAICDTAVMVGSETIYWKRRDASTQTDAWKQFRPNSRRWHEWWGLRDPTALNRADCWDPDGTQGGIPICWRCIAKQFDWRCPQCRALTDGWNQVCAACCDRLRTQHLRQCARCEQPFMAVPTWELAWTAIRGSPSQTLCSECHARDPHMARGILSDQLRRAKKNGRRATLTNEQWAAAIVYFDYRCAYCQQRPFAQLDHFIPLHVPGGGTTADNCLPACRPCNTSKHRKHPDIWLRGRSAYAEQTALARAYLAQMRRGEQPRQDITETATLALSEPTRWGHYIVVRVSDWPEQVHEFRPRRRAHWRNAGEWAPALAEISEQFKRCGYHIVYAESAI